MEPANSLIPLQLIQLSSVIPNCFVPKSFLSLSLQSFTNVNSDKC